jgi:polysaccharide biosynthesis protein PslG
MRPRLLAGALLGALALTLPPATAPAAVGRDFYGVISINSLTASDFDAMGQAKVGTLRTILYWPAIEPTPGQYNWSELDMMVGQAAQNGIEVLPFVYGTPGWVGVDCHGLSGSECERVPPIDSDAARDAWKGFLRAVAQRYGPGGAFWQENPALPNFAITLWQIWNEPSSPTYWAPKPSTRKYAKLVQISDAAISEVDPNAKILLAGLFGTPQGDSGSRNVMWKFLGRLYKVNGFKKHFHAIALHPYSPNLEGIEFQLRKAFQKVKKYRDNNVGVWISEIGWGSDPPTPDKPLIKGPEGQKRLLEKSFSFLLKHRREWNIEGLVWYSWQDPTGTPQTGCAFCSSSGLFEEDGSKKPAYDAFVRITGGS